MLGLTAVLLLNSTLAAPGLLGANEASAQDASSASTSFAIKLGLSPDVVENQQGSHNLGVVQLVANTTGAPVLAPQDFEVELSSLSPNIATVPSKVTIPKGSDYAKFDVEWSGALGDSTITAAFGSEVVNRTFTVVEAGSQISNEIGLVIDLPSNKMQIGSEMPISVYLENNGEIMQVSNDITVLLDYDRSLVKISPNSLIIEKGSYYAVGTVTSLEKSGNAFIRVSTADSMLDAVSTIEISQTQPASLRIFAFPEKVTINEKNIDVFVGLIDSEGNPTVASSDIQLELFASTSGVLNIANANPVIRKGEFGTYVRQSILFYAGQNVTIGATAPGLGASTANFEVLGVALLEDDPKVHEKLLKIYTLPSGMPSDATSVVIYQLNAIEQNADDGTDVTGDGVVDSKDFHPIDDLDEGGLYPIQTNVIYSPGQGNINVVTTDITALRVIDPGSINARSSYGAATVASGREPLTVDVSVSLAETASNTAPLVITGSLTPVQTMIYSPGGKEVDEKFRVPFNQAGTADLYILTIDSSGRPARSESGVEYLIQPTNELTKLLPDTTFSGITIQSGLFSALEPLANMSAIPVGINADSLLKIESEFHMIFSSSATAQVMFPFESMIGFSRPHSIGAVQLTDMFGAPLVASEDVSVRLSASSGSLPATSIIIPRGKSFASFELVPAGKGERITVSASAEGIRSTSASIVSALAELSGDFATTGSLVATQPSTVTVSTDEGTGVAWKVPDQVQITSQQEKAITLDPSTNSYLASAQVVAPAPGSYLIEATLTKNGFKTVRLASMMTFEPYKVPLNIIIFNDAISIKYLEPVTMSLRVTDANAMPVPDAIVRINPGPNATAVPSIATTDAGGMVSFVYTPTGVEARGFITATAEKGGYGNGVQTTNFDVQNIPFALPSWLIFGIIGAGAAAAGGGGIYFYKKPKMEGPITQHEGRELPEGEETDINLDIYDDNNSDVSK